MPMCQLRVSLGSLIATKSHEITTQTNDTKCFVLISPRVIQPTSICRNNLQGATLRAGTVIIQPELFTGMHDLKLRHIDTWTKINYILVEQMSMDLNLNFILHYFNNWGSQNNGNYDGLVGSLQRQELDLGATGMIFKGNSLSVMEYVGETFQFRASIIFRQPSLASITNIFLHPFSTNVWMCAVIIFTMKVIALTLEMRVEVVCLQKLHKRKKKNAKVTKRDIHFGEVIMMVVGAACQQGYYSPPSCFSARITFLALWFTSLFLFTSYAATVVALLQTPSHLVRSLADLVNGPMEVGIEDKIYNHVYFKETTDPLAIKLYRKKIEPRYNEAFYDAMEGMEKVKRGLFAFQVEHTIGYKIISETFAEGEKYYLGNVELFPTLKLGIPIARDSPYKEIFAQKLHYLREVGVLDRTLKQWIPQKPSFTHTHSSGLRQFVCIGLEDLHPAFSLLYAGAILGILLLGIEYLIQQYLNRKKAIFHSRKF